MGNNIVGIETSAPAASPAADDASRLAELFDDHPDGQFVKDTGGRWLMCNRAMAALLGRPVAEIVGRSDAQLFGEAVAARERAEDERVVGQQRWELSSSGLAAALPPGRRYEVLKTPLRARTACAPALRGLVRDVTELRSAIDRIEQAARRRDEAQALARLGSWEVDLETNLLDVSGQTLAIFDIVEPPAQLTAQAFLDRTHPDDRPAASEVVRRSRQERMGFSMTYRVILRDGRIRHVHDRCTPAGGTPGQPSRLVGTVQDVTDRIETEDALRRSEQRLHLALDASAQGMWDLDLKRGLATVTPQYARLIGHDPESFVATLKRFRAAVLPQDYQRLRRTFAEHASGRSEFFRAEFRARRADGSLRWYVVRGSIIERDARGRAQRCLGTMADAQEVKDAQAALERREREYRELFDHTPLPQVVIDCGDVRLLTVNEAFTRHYGWSRDEAIGMPLEWLHALDERDEANTSVRFFTGLRYRRRWRHVLKDGTPRDVEVSAHDLIFEGRRARIASIADVTEQLEAERLREKITEDLERRVFQRTAELDASLAQLRRVNQGLETFTYSVSHDLKAPLRGIDGYSRLLQTEYADRLDDEGRGFVARIRSATQQMGQLIDDLLAYSRLERRELALQRLAPDALARGVLASFADEAEQAGIALRDELGELPPIVGDAQGLTVALRNLVDNAMKFSVRADEPTIRVVGSREPGRVRLSVIDNGVGFDMKFHERIFAIFQRLHRAEDYPGTGIGLAIVAKAMERMGGRVWAESAPGRGATFHLELPEAEGPAAEPSRAAAPAAPSAPESR